MNISITYLLYLKKVKRLLSLPLLSSIWSTFLILINFSLGILLLRVPNSSALLSFSHYFDKSRLRVWLAGFPLFADGICRIVLSEWTLSVCFSFQLFESSEFITTYTSMLPTRRRTYRLLAKHSSRRIDSELHSIGFQAFQWIHLTTTKALRWSKAKKRHCSCFSN